MYDLNNVLFGSFTFIKISIFPGFQLWEGYNKSHFTLPSMYKEGLDMKFIEHKLKYCFTNKQPIRKNNL
uniref:Uncharacterized protein n=1 Tax=Arion vulgaris TaxID=1028688 RepID=A0A0B7A467_9EUPU